MAICYSGRVNFTVRGRVYGLGLVDPFRVFFSGSISV